jgi:hypothetical protein
MSATGAPVPAPPKWLEAGAATNAAFRKYVAGQALSKGDWPRLLRVLQQLARERGVPFEALRDTATTAAIAQAARALASQLGYAPGTIQDR